MVKKIYILLSEFNVSYNNGEPKGYLRWYSSREEMEADHPHLSELEYIEVETEIYLNDN